MKYANFERWKITLTTASPVFIGASNAEQMSKKECVYDQEKGLLYVPDIPALIEEIRKRNSLDAFEAFLLKQSGQTPAQSLKDFLRNLNIPLRADAPWVRYVVRVASGEFNSLNTVHCFVKNAEGLPYIPGSSIKGAIRTALLAARSIETGLKTMTQSAEQNPKRRWPGPEEFPLCLLRMLTKPGKENDAVNDLLKALSVSDSAPSPWIPWPCAKSWN